MLVCNICGEVISEEELRTYKEIHGYSSLGQAFAERFTDFRCDCGGDYVEATECACCGKWFDNEDLHGICEGCLEDYETLDNAIKIGEQYTEKVEINNFLASVFTAEQINEILATAAKERFADHSKEIVDYLECDKQAFSEWVIENFAG
jgi:hypothetical protein